MAELGSLQRSTISFRRQGSSGLIWDDKFLAAGDLNKMLPPHEHQANKDKVDYRELRPSRSVGSTSTLRSSTSSSSPAVARQVPFRSSVKVSTTPNVDPPSPKISGCGLCGFFGKPVAAAHRPKSRKR